MDIELNKALKTPLYNQIAASLRAKIIMNEIVDGSILPSERMMAAKLGVHRNTVIKAYKELESAGLVESRQGVGYIVTLVGTGDGNLDSRELMKHGGVNWAHMIKDEYYDVERTFDDLFSKSYDENICSFAAGMAASGIYDDKDLLSGLEAAVNKGKHGQYFYTPYQGDQELRKQIAAFMRERGARVEPSEIQVFSELNQALDFLAALMLKPGDTVITEEPISPDVYRSFEMAGVNQITVPMDKNGMFCDNLEPLIWKYNPKFIYINSSYHDPTGSILSYERRKKLLELSYRYRVPIIEDDAASLLDYSGAGVPPLKVMDKGDNVIYIYSFELTFIPGLNVTFVVAPKTLVQSLSYMVSMRMVALDNIPQKLLEHFLREGLYHAGVGKMRTLYREKLDLMYGLIEEAGIEDFYARKPQGGVYIWAHIPDRIHIKDLARICENRGVAFIPGSVFYPSGKQPANFIRLNFSVPSEEEIRKGMGILTEVIRELGKTEK